MHKKTFAATLLGLTLATSCWAAPGTQTQPFDPKAACERYAQEDQIKPQHMEDYLSQCLRDLSHDPASDQDLDPAPLDEQPVEPNAVAPKAVEPVAPNKP